MCWKILCLLKGFSPQNKNFGEVEKYTEEQQLTAKKWVSAITLNLFRSKLFLAFKA